MLTIFLTTTDGGVNAGAAGGARARRGRRSAHAQHDISELYSTFLLICTTLMYGVFRMSGSTTHVSSKRAPHRKPSGEDRSN